ncbi:MAG: DUF2089 domain-containing protein [Fimbriimonadaceae bacterium]
MSHDKLHDIPARDPVSGKEFIVTELFCEESGVTVRGRFAVPRYAKLDPEQAKFLEAFLRCRGMLNSVERELGISYPTVRSRLDALLQALDLTPVRDDSARREKNAERRRKILEQLEAGEITPEEAKKRIKEEANR